MAHRLSPKKCYNPQCQTGTFHPNRRDQKFCTKLCKDDFHNNLRNLRNKTDYALEKVIRSNEKKLERIYNSPLHPDHQVPESLLAYEQVSISVGSNTEVNTKTNRLILWSHRFGIEYMGKLPRFYIIHKK